MYSASKIYKSVKTHDDDDLLVCWQDREGMYGMTY